MALCLRLCRGVETRITQEGLRRHVLRVLRCWRERFVFGDDYLNGLQVWLLHCMPSPHTRVRAHTEKQPALDAHGPGMTQGGCPHTRESMSCTVSLHRPRFYSPLWSSQHSRQPTLPSQPS